MLLIDNGWLVYNNLYKTMCMIQKIKTFFSQHSFANINSSNFFPRSFEFSLIPAICSLCFGLVICFSSNSYIDSVFMDAIEEFLQLKGIHISLAVGLTLVGLTCFTNQFSSLHALLKWLTTSVAYIGFTFSAVASGTLAGMVIPSFISSLNFAGLIIPLFFSFYFCAVQWVFAAMSEMVNDETPLDNPLVLTLSKSEFKVYLGAVVLAICFTFIVACDIESLL